MITATITYAIYPQKICKLIHLPVELSKNWRESWYPFKTLTLWSNHISNKINVKNINAFYHFLTHECFHESINWLNKSNNLVLLLFPMSRRWPYSNKSIVESGLRFSNSVHEVRGCCYFFPSSVAFQMATGSIFIHKKLHRSVFIN